MDSEGNSQYSKRYIHAAETLLSSPETTIEFSRELLWQLKSDSDSLARRQNRWAFYIVVFVCVFELLNRGIVSNASVSGFQINHLSFLAYLLPPAVAFCFLNISTSAEVRTNYRRVIEEIIKIKFPGLYASEIHYLLIPKFGLPSNWIPSSFLTRRGEFNNNLYFGTQVVLLIGGSLAFEIYSYVQLFNHARRFNTGALISLIITASFVIMIVLRMIDLGTDSDISSSD